MRKCGLNINRRGFGWHSIRRSLVTELVAADVSLLNVVRFMRWSEGSARSEFSMVAIYAKRNQETIDRAVFKVHPFVKFWSEGTISELSPENGVDMKPGEQSELAESEHSERCQRSELDKFLGEITGGDWFVDRNGTPTRHRDYGGRR